MRSRTTVPHIRKENCANFHFRIFHGHRYIAGIENQAADALSYIDTVSASVDVKALAAAQWEDPELTKMQQNPRSLMLAEIPLPYTTTMVTCDTSQKAPRPFVPIQFRRAVFDSLHDLSHPEIRATQRLVRTALCGQELTPTFDAGRRSAEHVKQSR